MKLFRFMAVAAAATLLGSCSNELVPEEQPGNGDMIRVRATAESHTRAVESYCNNDLPKDFQLYAWTSDTQNPYIHNEKVVSTDGGKTYSFDDVDYRYWPKEGNLDFFAYRNNGEECLSTENGLQFKDYVIKSDVAKQHDLIYAVKKNAAKADGAVNLNFRHALSQVVFRMKVTNKTLKVNVRSVEIGHLNNQGTFNVPADGTDETWGYGEGEDHNDELVGDVASIVNHWDLTTLSGNESYEVSVVDPDTKAPVSATYGEGEKPVIVNLTQTPNGHADGINVKEKFWSNVMTLLPQQQNAWDPENSKTEFDGAYVCLDCDVYNMCEGGKDEIVHTGKTYIPLSVDWKEGVRYIYTFDFANGNGGYTKPDEENPEVKPVMQNIKVEVSTDDFISAEDYNVVDKGGVDYVVHCWTNVFGISGPSDRGHRIENGFNNMPSTWEFRISDYIKNLEKAPHKFLGWASGKRTEFLIDKEDIIKTLSLDESHKSAVLTAVWEYHYYVKYDLNGKTADVIEGENIIPDEDYILTSNSDFEGYTISLKNPNWTCGKYKFVGWSKNPKATTGDITSVDFCYNVLSMDDQVTVYAIWKEIE